MTLAEILVAAASSPEKALVDEVASILNSDDFRRTLVGLLTVSADLPHSTLIGGAFAWLLDAILRFGFPDDVPINKNEEWGG